MLGLMINDQEKKELEYVLRRELEEILFDMEEPRIDEVVKQSMRLRYQDLFRLYRRVASEEDCLKYIPKKAEHP